MAGLRMDKDSLKIIMQYATVYNQRGMVLHYNELFYDLCKCNSELTKKSKIVQHINTDNHKLALFKYNLKL